VAQLHGGYDDDDDDDDDEIRFMKTRVLKVPRRVL